MNAKEIAKQGTDTVEAKPKITLMELNSLANCLNLKNTLDLDDLKVMSKGGIDGTIESLKKDIDALNGAILIALNSWIKENLPKFNLSKIDGSPSTKFRNLKSVADAFGIDFELNLDVLAPNLESKIKELESVEKIKSESPDLSGFYDFLKDLDKLSDKSSLVVLGLLSNYSTPSKKTSKSTTSSSKSKVVMNGDLLVLVEGKKLPVLKGKVVTLSDRKTKWYFLALAINDNLEFYAFENSAIMALLEQSPESIKENLAKMTPNYVHQKLTVKQSITNGLLPFLNGTPNVRVGGQETLVLFGEHIK